jgi:curved DNA-binding protein CbpA
MGTRLTHYQIFGLEEKADLEQIRAAWHRIAKKTHPDRNPGNERALRLFKRAAEAWDVLSDPDLRHAYDATLHPPETTPNTPKCKLCSAPVLVLGQELCVRCSIVERVPRRRTTTTKGAANSPTVEVDFEDVLGSRSRAARDYEQPIPDGSGSMFLLEALLVDASAREAFAGGEASGRRSVIEVQQGKTKVRIEVDPDSLRAFHNNLKTSWKIFKVVRDIIGG